MSVVSQVSSRYFNALGTRIDLTQYPQIIENTFTAELYHCYRNIMDLSNNNYYYNDLILHFDISKFGGNMRPDLVLHKAQENRNNQKMFVEIKANSNVNLVDDYSKLYNSIIQLDFENVVLVTLNRDITLLENDIRCFFIQRNPPISIINKVTLININTTPNNINYQIANLN